MKRKFLNLLLLALVIIVQNSLVIGQDSEKKKTKQIDQCYECHKEIEILPIDFSESDIHKHANFSCASCHGGDPNSTDQEVAMSSSKGFISVPAKKDIPKICGKCHSSIDFMRAFQPRIATDQVSQYHTSVHGKKLKAGDENVAECTSCHTAHSIMSAKDPRSSVYALNVPATCDKCHGNESLMKKYNLTSNPLTDFKKSVHGIALLENSDLGAPACNDCHGNHGATPPGVTSIAHVCGNCHVTNMELFGSSKKAKIFEDLGYHGCEQCHGMHLVLKPNDEMIGIGKNSICIECHSSGDEGYKVAEKIENDLTKLRSQLNKANIKLEEVKQKGMNDVDINFILKDAKQALIQSRTLTHTFDSIKVGEKTKEGYKNASEAILLAQNEIDEYYTRRNGFAAATLIFLIIVLVLYFKIKDKEKANVKNSWRQST